MALSRREKFNNAWKNFAKMFRYRFKMAKNYAVKQYKNEAINMYNFYIDEFYKYRTTSYIRHGTDARGTCKGVNLYRGKDMYTSQGYIENPTVHIGFTSDFLDDYKYDYSDVVLTYVMSGIRFYKNSWNDRYWEVPDYEGKYFSRSGGGTMFDAFEEYEKSETFNQICEICIEEYFKMHPVDDEKDDRCYEWKAVLDALGVKY